MSVSESPRFDQAEHDSMCQKMDILFEVVGLDAADDTQPTVDTNPQDNPYRSKPDESRRQAAEYFGKNLFPRLIA